MADYGVALSDGWVFPEELDFLYNTCKKYLRCQTLEVGSFKGLSTSALAKGSYKVTCIDFFEPSGRFIQEGDYYQVFKRNMEHIGVWDKLYVRKGNSHVILPTLINENRKFDVIFIDASHLYEDVIQDIRDCLNLAHSNTTLVMDDWVYGGVPYQGVQKAALECFQAKDINLIGKMCYIQKISAYIKDRGPTLK